MSYMTAGKLQAFEALMKEIPGHNHYDSGCDGICPECRSCCFHRPYWKYQTCVFEECPYLLTALYNASLTIDNYYSARVNYDFHGKG